MESWNPDALDEWAASVASAGERIAAQFVLQVWNQFHPWKCGPFNVVEAYSRWDKDNWQAFVSWADDPFAL